MTKTWIGARGVELAMAVDAVILDEDVVIDKPSSGLEPDTEVHAVPAALALIRQLENHGTKIAVVSSSMLGTSALSAAHAELGVDAVVDGRDAAALNLPAPPDPSMYLDAARRLGVEPPHAALVVDSVDGVTAGRRAAFAVVAGLDKRASGASLRAAGARLIVGDLRDLEVFDDGSASTTPSTRYPTIVDRR